MNLLFHHIQGTEWIFGICRNIFQGIQGFVMNELLVGINLSIDNRITFRLRLGYLLDAHNQECDDSGGCHRSAEIFEPSATRSFLLSLGVLPSRYLFFRNPPPSLLLLEFEKDSSVRILYS